MTKKEIDRKNPLILWGIRSISAILIALAVSVFFTPNKIINGGVSGIATILHHTVGLPVGISFGVINGLLLLIGIKILGKEFIITTIYISTILSVFLELFTVYLPSIKLDSMTAALFGSVIYGLGLGIAFATGTSSGGTDILGRIIQAFSPNIPIGKILLAVDGVIILASFVIFKEANLVCYGIIALFVSTATIDWVIAKLNVSRIAFVITDKGDEISQFLVSKSPRGVTLIDV